MPLWRSKMLPVSWCWRAQLRSRAGQTVRAEALQLLAFGFLLTGRVADADAAIAAMPKGFHPHSSLMDLRRAPPNKGQDGR